MKVYISGPMTNQPHFNRPAFFTAAKRLHEAGDIPLNPALLPDGLSQTDYMAICMSMLQRADGIYLLDGWEDSAGASAEYHLAYKLQLKIMAQQCISIHAKEVIKNMSSSNGTVVGAMSPAAQSNIDGKLSISWDAIHSLDSRINTLADRLLPVSNPTESGSATGDKVKLSEPNASPIALAIMSQAQQLGTLVNKLDEITARLDC